jgi:hypothetical protein
MWGDGLSSWLFFGLGVGRVDGKWKDYATNYITSGPNFG